MAEWKTDFLDRLAHDLRGPLSPLQTAAYLLKRPDMDPERQRELVDIVDRQSARLSAMVGEIGDWIRAQQQRLVLHREVTPLDMLLELATGPVGGEVRTGFAPGMAEAGVNGDPQRLVQMFGTLGAFARARRPDGPLRIDVQPDGEGHARIVFDAPGDELPPAVVDELFVAQQPAPFDDGLGLRLIIARGIAEAHGGTLEAACTPGGDLRLSVRLPVTPLA